MSNNKLIFAVPKGRILEELTPLFNAVNIVPEDEFFKDESRKLRFRTNNNNIDLIKVRSFDVATFLAYGAAHMGVVGKDVLMEFNTDEIYAPLDLNIGKCKLSLATKKENKDRDYVNITHLTIATKYPESTKKFFASKGVQAEPIKLNGAIELAPILGLCDYIVDLVSTGNTLKANKLEEVEVIEHISSYLAVNRTIYKTRNDMIKKLYKDIKEVTNDKNN